MKSDLKIEGIEVLDDSDEDFDSASTSDRTQLITISKEEFLANLKKISQVTCRSFDAGEHWLMETRHGITHLKNVSIVEGTKTGVVLERTVSVTYNEVYKVPVFWFSYKIEGTDTLMFIEELEKTLDCSAFAWNSAVNDGMTTSLSEHPVTGELLYQCHSCQTSQLMNFAKNSKNYVLSWLSFTCSQFRIPFDFEWSQILL